MSTIFRSPLALWLAGIFIVTKANAQSIGVDIGYRGYASNYEYFNPIVSGYTLFGHVFQPTLGFRLDSAWSLNAGAWLQQDFGRGSFRRVQPDIRLQYKHNDFSFRFGTIDIFNQHGLPSWLYDSDDFITRGPAYGIQATDNGYRFNSDTWLAWRRMIYPESVGQEQIEAGTSWKINLLDSSVRTKIYIPLHGIVLHRGGQIGHIDSTQHVTTLYGVAEGLGMARQFENALVTSAGAEALATYCNNEDVDILPVGKSLSVKAFVNLQGGVNVETSWWVGDNFFMPTGAPLYQSRSSVYAADTVYLNQRQFLFFTATWKRTLSKGLKVEAWVQPYYDINLELLEYAYRLRLTYAFNATLKRFD